MTSDSTPPSDNIERLEDGILRDQTSGAMCKIEPQDETMVVKEIGDRFLDECPVSVGSPCVDPTCSGHIEDTERNASTYSAFDYYCPACGLSWVRRGARWREFYTEHPTAFDFVEQAKQRVGQSPPPTSVDAQSSEQ